MRVIDLISNTKTTAFSFEILPPLKGNNIVRVYQTIDLLRPFDPKYINITTHRSELVYKEVGDNLYKKMAERHRPGTVAIAAAIQNKYKINVVPHLICSGFTKSETEYALIDLQFLGIHDLLVLRGDKAKHEKNFAQTNDGHAHAIDLQDQVNDFNAGKFLDGSSMEHTEAIFSYGVAGYPEKHDEAPNMDSDIYWLKEKVKRGAEYVVTQMFFDNEKYFAFVDRCRAEGINVPIIPGLKPITFMNQLTALPKIFHVDMPEPLVLELNKCKTDAAATEVGVEWCTMQAKELKQHGVPSIHFYTLMATQSVKRVAEQVY
ncbi:methylenetetrahydrofolate reductase [NAD(P)H] [Microbacter margulisiae]|uniref:Methylenetetrahydrofolate reductase n=1 Tax=Microbacter margulisiae TaxID=1350067 RepID=A0A7W5H0U3_9PORP|nr:methylenetetrahydrofolate reductase [NAD(P)H] [Microbacter margulisiae]MBB3186050.1 methylenetetrahydrofolate reductase (NADPH) [Microbacter margulisiae]